MGWFSQYLPRTKHYWEEISRKCRDSNPGLLGVMRKRYYLCAMVHPTTFKLIEFCQNQRSTKTICFIWWNSNILCFQTKPLVDGCYVEQFTEVALVVVVVGVGGFGVVVGVAVVVGVYRISKKLHWYFRRGWEMLRLARTSWMPGCIFLVAVLCLIFGGIQRHLYREPVVLKSQFQISDLPRVYLERLSIYGPHRRSYCKAREAWIKIQSE